eukprot:TRINITY_DN23032_c0_g2_i1.p1 TRINITY_DN23032_c0_g2~~TRINITY_DN23032_c0_g2_i1.p1  ORF type:complete len:343 (-),score=54.62 TRINITY_DN23032_c0_g2_i1:296-1237(-)
MQHGCGRRLLVRLAGLCMPCLVLATIFLDGPFLLFSTLPFLKSRTGYGERATGVNAQGRRSEPVKRRRLARRVIPLRQADGWEAIANLESDAASLADVIEARVGPGVKQLDDGRFELVIPDDSDDLGPLADLVDESFARFLDDRKVDENQFGAPLWNAWITLSERQLTLGAVRKRLLTALREPSLSRPRGYRAAQDWSLSVMLVAKGTVKPVAYFELQLKSPNNRDAALQPYLLNLCTAERAQRRGLGRLMLRLAEAIGRDGWRGDRMFLDTDDDPGPLALYKSEGWFTTRKGRDAMTGGRKVGMCKEFYYDD